jgi:four helix bundle protein
MDLVDFVYTLSSDLPRFEDFGLRSQMTRSAVSVAANIAEGQARSTSRDFANFLTMARASLLELETLIEVALRQQYISDEQSEKAMAMSDEIGRMISGLRKSILNGRTRR